MCSLLASYRFIKSAWDNVPCNDQTIEYLTLRLLREETLNQIEESTNEEAAFLASGSGSGQKQLSSGERKKHIARIAKLKKKTKCKACGKTLFVPSPIKRQKRGAPKRLKSQRRPKHLS
jgi:hypothetical protein